MGKGSLGKERARALGRRREGGESWSGWSLGESVSPTLVSVQWSVVEGPCILATTVIPTAYGASLTSGPTIIVSYFFNYYLENLPNLREMRKFPP